MNLTIDIGNTRTKAALFDEKGRLVRAMNIDNTTPVPIKNLYGTPETLGMDRLAAAVGASVMFPSQAVLIVDFGTAITFDIVTAEGEYLGGNISPGAKSRLRALHDYTSGTLPMCELPEEEAVFPAKNTKDAIRSGVVKGIVAEVKEYIKEVRERFGEDVKIIFTGGDAEYFAKRVKFPIFVASELVLYGLNAILEYNAK